MHDHVARGGWRAPYGAVLGERKGRMIAKDAGFETPDRPPIEDPFHILDRLR
jgi:hypothetical protein